MIQKSIKAETTVPDVSVIVVSYNTLELTRACIESISKYSFGLDVETIVVDNASIDGSPESIAEVFPHVHLIANEDNRGFAAANNQGLEVARGRYILLLNSDAEVLEDTIADSIKFIERHPDVGVVGCRTIYPDGRPQPSILRFHRLRYLLVQILVPNRVSRKSRLLGAQRYVGADFNKVIDVEVVAGLFMLVKRQVVEEVGGMDERFFMYGEEAEWCFRIRKKGWRVFYYPDATVIHHNRGSSVRAPRMRTLALARGSLLFFQLAYGARRAYLANLIMLMRDLPRTLIRAGMGVFPRMRRTRPWDELTPSAQRIPLLLSGLFRPDWTGSSWISADPPLVSRRKVLFAPIRRLSETLARPNETRRLNDIPTDYGPPCFIVGPPRSGTTLLYELMVRHLGMSYVSNLAHSFYEAPISATQLGLSLIDRWRTSALDQYSNTYGQIQGWGAPNEGGNLWDQWLPRDVFLDAQFVKHLPADHIRATVSGISNVMQGPFLNKNVMHSVHMRVLDQLFPSCIFIHLVRDPLSNARSIIRYRRKMSATEEEMQTWRSVKPREWKRFADKPYPYQACAQIHFTHENIRHDSSLLGGNRRLEISYEELCSRPAAVLGTISDFLSGHGVKVTRRGQAPEFFESPRSQPLAADVEDQLQNAMAEIQELNASTHFGVTKSKTAL